MLKRHAILVVSAVLLLGPLLADAQEVLRDPTRPYNAARVSAPTTGGTGGGSFKVTAIFTSEMRRVAIVNGQRVVEGDRVGGATVTEILANGIKLNLNGKAITRRVLPRGLRH